MKRRDLLTHLRTYASMVVTWFVRAANIRFGKIRSQIVVLQCRAIEKSPNTPPGESVGNLEFPASPERRVGKLSLILSARRFHLISR